MLRYVLLLSALEGLASLVVCAQPAPSCSASTPDPVVISSEAVSEMVPDYVIQCRGGTPTPAGQAIPRINLLVVLNTNITSRLLAKSPDLSEALLLVDEPAPQNQLPCPMLPCSIQGTGGGTSPYDGSAGHYNVFQATKTVANRLEWTGVPFDPPGTAGVRTLRITNVRANMYSIAHRTFFCGGCLGDDVVGFVGSAELTIDNPQQTLAWGQDAVRFQTTTAVFPPTFSHNPNAQATDLKLTFTEALPDFFKPRTTAPPDDISSDANQNFPGKSYGSASGFYNASFTGTYAGAGLATQGTRLVARFENVPPGVNLFVTAQPIVSTFPFAAQLVSTGPNAAGPYNPIPAAANGFAPIPVDNGVALAVWEVTSASPTVKESAQFGVALSYSADPANPIVHTGAATVRGSVGPFTDVFTASLTDPAPRFGPEEAPQPAFKVGYHLTPSVSAVVNGADFSRNLPVAPGSVAAIFGLGLTSSIYQSYPGPQPPFGGITVQINRYIAPILAATPTQVDVQIPWELAGVSEASLTVAVDRVESDPVTIKLADTAPYIFTRTGQPWIVKPSPFGPGGTLNIYGTGFGPVQNPPATGAPAPDLTSTTLDTPTVTIAGAAAEVIFSGLAPGIVGVWEVSVRMPDGVAVDSGVPLQLSIGGVAANPVVLH